MVDHRAQVVEPKGAPPKSRDLKEGESRQVAKWVCCGTWRGVLKEKCDGLPVVCHDGCWNDAIASVECVFPDAPGHVFENGEDGSVIGDCSAGPVGSVSQEVSDVDVHVVGESELSDSWAGDQNVV